MFRIVIVLGLVGISVGQNASACPWTNSTLEIVRMTSMLKTVETIFGGGTSKLNANDVKAYEELLSKSLAEAMLRAQAYNFKDTDESVANLPILRAAEAAKAEFVSETLVKVARETILETQTQEQE